MRKSSERIFLFGGLIFLFIAFVIRWLGASNFMFGTFLILGISLKTVFLITIFRSKGFRPGPGLYLILAGITMILVSLLFKTICPLPIIRNMLFYGAILLKITGLILIIFEKRSLRIDKSVES